jgi:hypothetical protein
MWILLNILLIAGQPDITVVAKTTTMTECINLLKQQPRNSGHYCVYAKTGDKTNEK